MPVKTRVVARLVTEVEVAVRVSQRIQWHFSWFSAYFQGKHSNSSILISIKFCMNVEHMNYIKDKPLTAEHILVSYTDLMREEQSYNIYLT